MNDDDDNGYNDQYLFNCRVSKLKTVSALASIHSHCYYHEHLHDDLRDDLHNDHHHNIDLHLLASCTSFLLFIIITTTIIIVPCPPCH